MTGAGLRFTTSLKSGHIARAAALGLVVCALAACTVTGGGSAAPQASSENAGSVDAFTGIELSLWRSGQEAERTNQYDQAVGAYLNLYGRYPENVQVLTALVRNLRYSGRAQDGVRLVEEAAPTVLEDVTLKFEYGKAQLAAGQKAQALATFEQVALMLPDDWQVFSAMGIAHDSRGNYGAAIGAYQHALTLSPDNPVILNNLAMSQAMSGQLLAAIRTLETAAGLNRSNPHIRQNLALLYAINGDADKAKALASMDLSASDLENNMTFYRRFEGDDK